MGRSAFPLRLAYLSRRGQYRVQGAELESLRNRWQHLAKQSRVSGGNEKSTVPAGLFSEAIEGLFDTGGH